METEDFINQMSDLSACNISPNDWQDWWARNDEFLKVFLNSGDYLRIKPDVQSFAEADACIDAVLQLSQGKALTAIGTPATRERGRGVGQPEIRGNQIVGSFLDFDSYGNGITNITKAHFEAVGKGRMFTIMVGGQILQTDTISTDYTNVPEKIIALFNSARFLEIAMPYFPLRNFLHDTNTAKVLITFYDSEAQKTNFKLI